MEKTPMAMSRTALQGTWRVELASQLFARRLRVNLAETVASIVPDLEPRECVLLVAPDEGGSALVLAAPSSSATIPERVLRIDRLLAPHLAAAVRLRRQVQALREDGPLIEGIFRPDGTCLGATCALRKRGFRQILRAEVLRADRAKAAQAASDSELTMGALVAGRWTLVERFESAGQRYFVAYRNPPGLGDVRRLTKGEKDTAFLAAQGLADKEIGSALGVSPSTAAGYLRTALKKLGLSSPLLLPVLWSDGTATQMLPNHEMLGYFRSPERMPSGVQLTDAEAQVLRAALNGECSDSIAERRSTSVRTVSNQLAKVFEKTGTRSRRELAARAAGTA